MKRRYRIWVDLDVASGTSARAVLSFDGVKYELTAVPFDNLERLRKLLEEGEGQSSFGGEGNEPAISLGPRGGGCPMCGR